MQIITRLNDLRAARAALPGTVALVPTMGALHAGHLALVASARELADHVVASIFVNPTQFGAGEDLGRYPRQEAADADLLRDAGVALLWLPDVVAMYPPGFATSITVGPIAGQWCGATRPGHFAGVATVVAKLFNQVRPTHAVFGDKDWQQLAVIRRMAADLDHDVAITGVATVRDADGLARSSRNAYLNPADRTAAVGLPRALTMAADAIRAGADVATTLDAARVMLAAAGFAVEYVALVDATLAPVATLAPDVRLLAAARIGSTRLIDNLAV